MQLQPLETFPIVRQLDNVSDAATYYPQAVVRNARTDVVITTVNLSLKASQRYVGTFSVPRDTTGQGFHISITTIVYTDAAHTVPSTVYGAEIETYLVQNRPNIEVDKGRIAAVIPVAEAPAVDYTKIEKIISKIVASIDNKELKEELLEAIGGITIPEFKDADLSPILGALGEAEGRIHSKIESIPQPGPVDHSPVISALGEAENRIHQNVKESSSTDLLGSVHEKFDQLIETLEKIDPTQLEKSLSDWSEKFGSLIPPSVEKSLKDLKDIDEVKNFLASLTAKKPEVEEVKKEDSPYITNRSGKLVDRETRKPL